MRQRGARHGDTRSISPLLRSKFPTSLAPFVKLRLYLVVAFALTCPLRHQVTFIIVTCLNAAARGGPNDHRRELLLCRLVVRNRPVEQIGSARYAMVRRRTVATGITAYLKNGSTLENAATMANHASARTTQLYERRRDEISLDEVERIRV
jgi:hypothetical protein